MFQLFQSLLYDNKHNITLISSILAFSLHLHLHPRNNKENKIQAIVHIVL